jgi:PAS domain S-box-containing protein
MEVWKAHYFQKLADFARHGVRVARDELLKLSLEMNDATEEAILKYHEESVHFLFANVEPEDRMTLAHRSVLFLTDLMIIRQAAEIAASGEPGDPDQMISSALQAIPPEELASANKFEAVLQHMDNGIALVDEAGTLRFLNVQLARFLRVPRSAVIGKTIFELLRNTALDRPTRRFMLRVLRELPMRRRFHGEYTNSEGKILRVSVTQAETLDGDYLISVRDVSEYKLIEQTAFQNDKLAMLGKIAAAIAHEIRNPLTAIRGFIQLLDPHMKEIGKQEYVRIILSEIDRANNIIFEFLNSSKPTAPLKQIVSVDSLLRESILLTESEANMKGCELHCEIFDPDMTVAVDVKQIKQVLLNMIRNALDAIQEAGDGRKGRIDISARREGLNVLITIRDNGKGMDRETMSRLFDPFFTTKQDGTGLGLSVSYRIINNHGGSIAVDSTPGEGTEFSIYLPHSDQKE